MPQKLPQKLKKSTYRVEVDKMRHCVSCRRPAEVLSWRGFCNDCVALRVIEAITQIREKKGPVYERWAKKLGMRKSSPRYIQTTLCNRDTLGTKMSV